MNGNDVIESEKTQEIDDETGNLIIIRTDIE